MKRETEAFLSADMFDVGLGSVVVARFRGNGEVEVGVFLVDVHCLGVKSAFYTRVSLLEYESRMLDQILPTENRKSIDPPSARKLVEGAVAYAEDLGFAPHPDYKRACRVFGGIKAADSTASFTYGSNGKPLYVQGPHESPQTCVRIIKQLRTRCGDGNFHYIVHLDAELYAELERAGVARP